jgi:hypothetical protein
MEPLRAVGEHRWRRLLAIEPPGVDLADVSDEVGLNPARPAEDVVKLCRRSAFERFATALSMLMKRI